MKSVTKNATVSTAYGEELAQPLKFTYSFTELESGDTIPENEVPSQDDILSLVNAKRNASARASEQSKQFKANGIEPKPLAENPALIWRNMVKNLIAAKKTQKDAETLATQLTGYSPNAETVSA